MTVSEQDTARFTDPELAAVAAAPDPFLGRDVVTIRAELEARAAARPAGTALHEVRDLVTPGGPARLYRPHAGPAALVLYLHGGGWSVGSVVSHDRPDRRRPAPRRHGGRRRAVAGLPARRTTSCSSPPSPPAPPRLPTGSPTTSPST